MFFLNIAKKKILFIYFLTTKFKVINTAYLLAVKNYYFIIY